MKTYPLTPNKIVQSCLSFSTRKVGFEEASYVQKIATRRSAKHTFCLEHYALNYQCEQLIINFFNDCKGSLSVFRFYNHVDGKYYECSFKSDTLSFNRINAGYSNLTLEVETC